ncbi:MAG: type II toxin-antitoxin system PemK/MazF family toxin [Candidatus Nanopelagicales bacterium]|nr:type II toxin-antitoxin system PemK/MazF family toxin [Candidatus Nanopelagicales bacterium]
MIERGAIHWVSFAPGRPGSEASKTRPAVVVSGDAANRAAVRFGQGVVTVCPMTSNITRLRSFEVRVDASASSGIATDSKIQASQIRSVDLTYIGERIGSISLSQQAQLDAALRLHLEL